MDFYEAGLKGIPFNDSSCMPAYGGRMPAATSKKRSTKKKKKHIASNEPEFIPGLELSQGFFYEVIRPLMEKHFPDLQYSAGLVGHGSDVLGFDSPTSIDHNWGPHVLFFLASLDFVAYKRKIDRMLKKHLPYEYRGFSTNFEKGDKYNKDKPALKKSGQVNHLCTFWTLQSFFQHYLGYDIAAKPIPSYQDWLLFPQQALIEITAGKLFHDALGVQKVRDLFAYYPDTIWKYMMRVQWGKILDELQTQARTGEAEDELGSRIITARMVQKVMFLCYLIERKYVPYSKWFGTGFSLWLKCAKTMEPLLLDALHEGDWKRRQLLLAKAYQQLGRMHNRLKITKPVSTRIVDFFGRGYPIIDTWKYVEALENAIPNEHLRNMEYPLGSVDQFIDHARINQLNYFYVDLKDVIK
jgi:hypothetical protein